MTKEPDYAYVKGPYNTRLIIFHRYGVFKIARWVCRCVMKRYRHSMACLLGYEHSARRAREYSAPGPVPVRPLRRQTGHRTHVKGHAIPRSCATQGIYLFETRIDG